MENMNYVVFELDMFTKEVSSPIFCESLETAEKLAEEKIQKIDRIPSMLQVGEWRLFGTKKDLGIGYIVAPTNEWIKKCQIA